MRLKRLALVAAVLVIAAGASFAGLAWRHEIAPIAPPAATSFDPALVARGAQLAAIGNCAGCHSAPGKPPYAGGVAIDTPFGTVYGTNITPDPDQGIGRWPAKAFIRALREGVDRRGHHLYPAFPYDHFTKVSAADDRALYAFLMTRPAAKTVIPPNGLPFPLSFRPLLAGWKLLFFRPGVFRPDPARDAAWNRGAYLVQGLGHCGACHTPRNPFGAERREARLDGGMAEGWNAYPLNAASPAPMPWSVDALAFYLGHGWETDHGVSRGPMAAVTANLARASTADLSAMGTYLIDGMGVPSQERQVLARTLAALPPPTPDGATAGWQLPVAPAGAGRGAAIFAAACASCHNGRESLPFGGLDLRKSTAIHAADPTNIIIVTLNGLPAAPGEASPIMPGFRGALDDGQLADLLAYLRNDVAHAPAWPDLGTTVTAARTRPVVLHPGDGTTTAPADTDVRTTEW